MESPMQTETEQVDAAAMPLDIQAITKTYTYSDLPKGNIRLLKLLPHRDITSPLQCSLIGYPLQDLTESNHHLYDSLSYAWGSPEKTQSISIDDCYLPITTNLHAALLRLRDRFLERIIWVDAICINQQDTDERGSQVQRMAMIYALANRVIVWLGEAEDDSDQALEEIYKNADGQPAGEDQNIQNAVLKLLQRPWFKRIWILQEVAAARSVLILCGSSEIEGYGFCIGINSLHINHAGSPGLPNLIRTATYLMRHKVLQPKQTIGNSDTFSLNIAPLSELMDMYHGREASDCRDKIYALLGMSSDTYNSGDLSPDYNVPWKTLFQQVIRRILCEGVLSLTWQDKEVAVIKSKGCTLGQVSSLKSDATWSDKQNVTFSKYATDCYEGFNSPNFWTLTLQTLANSIMKGDIICLLEGASKPTIIRPYKDYFIIVAIAINPAPDKEAEKADQSWVKVLQSVTDFPRNFLLVWDWTKSLSENGEEDKCLLSSQIFRDERPTQLMENGLIFSELKNYKKTVEILKRVIENYEKEFNGDFSPTIAAMANLAASYGDLGLYIKEKKWKKMVYILSDRQGVEKMVTDLINAFDEEVSGLFINWRWDQVTITEDIVKAAAAAKTKDMMELLLDQRGAQIIITEDVVKAAAGNPNGGEQVIGLLLDQRGDEITITEDIVKAAAGNKNPWNSQGIVRLLLKKRGGEITITEDIIAAANHWGVRKLLLNWRGN